MLGTCLSNFNALQPQLLFSPHSFLPLYEQTTKNHSSPSLESWDLRGSETVPILITQIFWGCRRPSLTTIVMDTELAQPITPPSLPPSLPHATQVAGGLGLSLTAANYRLTRPRCALHDCLAPRSGYPERGRNRERWRERWLGRTEKDRGRRREKERGDRKWHKGQRG